MSKQKFIFITLIYLLLSNLDFAYAKSDNSIIPRIEQKIKQYKNLFCGVYVKPCYKCSIPKEININGDAEFPAASLIKIPIAVVLLQKIDKKELSWNKTLILSRYHYAPGSGILVAKKPGTKISLKKVFKLMLTISDNTATNMIIDVLGGVNETNYQIAKLNKKLGLKNTTRLVNRLGDFKGTNKTSPRDLAVYLEESLEGNLLKKDSREFFRDTLLHVKNKSLIKRGLGEHTKFAHKTGTIGICVGDAGIIYLDKKKKASISIIVKRPFNSYQALELIRAISNVVHKAMEAK